MLVVKVGHRERLYTDKTGSAGLESPVGLEMGFLFTEYWVIVLS